jgi:HEAT repeat protein
LVDAACDARLPRERRLEALDQAATLGAGEGRALARAWAESVDAELRTAGLRALAKIGTPEDLPMVRQAALDPRPGVRFAAAEALRLAPSGDGDITATLERLLEDNDASVRAAALATYAYRPAGRERRLAAILQGAGDPVAPGVAAVSLLAAGDELALSILEPWLMEPFASNVPARFWSALAQVDDVRRAPFMRRLLDSRAEIVRTTAMRFLGEARDGDSEPLLRRALDSLRPADRATAATALARLGAREAVQDIAGRLRDVSDNVRAAAARALADLGAREAMADLVSALAHERLGTVREAIMEALNALETRGPARPETWKGT